MLTVMIYHSLNKDTFMIKLSELLEKLYNNSYLNDKEYETYLTWVSLLKDKEYIVEKSKKTTIK